MPNLSDLHLKANVLERYQLPDIAYPIRKNDLAACLEGSGSLPLASLLHGLQQRSRDGEAEWKQLEPAMDRMAELLAPDDARDVVSAAGDHWWLEVGPVELGGKLVTIQRGDALIAAITARDDGRLRVAVFRPLDAKSAEYLIGLGQVPHPEHGVCMRENNWEYALDCSVGNGNYYAADRGDAYLSYWEKGLGISWDGSNVPEWRKQLDLVARPAARVVAELGVYYTLSGNEDEEPVADSGLPHEEAIARLGQGWIAEEALAISIYCALVARNFRHGVILAVNHDGDSDSTGAIVGNLLEPLELRDVITELAEDLYAFKDWAIGEYSDNAELNQRIRRKYPGF